MSNPPEPPSRIPLASPAGTEGDGPCPGVINHARARGEAVPENGRPADAESIAPNAEPHAARRVGDALASVDP